MDKLQEEKREKALNLALRFLSFRSRSIKEVRDFLSKKGLPEKEIENLINYLVELGFLDDKKFAKTWIEERQKYKNKSRLALKLELQKKGVKPEIIEELLNESSNDYETAKEFIKKKRERFANLDWNSFVKRVAGGLRQKGFSWETIKKVLDEAKNEQ
jgi:regulatory protein